MEWVSVESRLPKKQQVCLFMVKSRDELYNRRVLGGTYIGDPKCVFSKYDFSTPGATWEALYWCPIPKHMFDIPVDPIGLLPVEDPLLRVRRLKAYWENKVANNPCKTNIAGLQRLKKMEDHLTK